MLVTQFPLPYADKAYSATLLAYVYLSRSIEQRGIDAWDSYRSRAQLFKYNKNPNVGLTIIMNNLGMGVLIEPFIISDYYFASQALRSPHKNTLQSAKSIHQWLENISVGGKEADEYSLSEMADFGKKRHNVLFKILEEKYKKGELNMTLDDLQKT
ncbi:MAG: hypothetical protein IPQ23_00055 [Cytophagaceae bacterium]|nr:hypothetical protein [Cytophagaceae bacterium]